jgi:hypothetical protein
MPTMDFKDAHAVARKASKVAKRIGYACLGCALGMDDRGLARLGWHEAEADYEDAFSHAGPTLMTWSSGSLFDGATEIIDYILGDHAISDILDLESELRGYRDEFVLANHQLSDSPGERPDHVISMAHSWNAALALLKEAAIDTHDLEDSLIYHAIRVLIRSNGGASEMLARTNAIARLADECLILARAPDKIDHPNDGTGDDPLPEDGPHQNGWVLNGEIIDDPMHRKAWSIIFGTGVSDSASSVISLNRSTKTRITTQRLTRSPVFGRRPTPSSANIRLNSMSPRGMCRQDIPL